MNNRIEIFVDDMKGIAVQTYQLESQIYHISVGDYIHRDWDSDDDCSRFIVKEVQHILRDSPQFSFSVLVVVEASPSPK